MKQCESDEIPSEKKRMKEKKIVLEFIAHEIKRREIPL
jgi:hypothetical protein